MINPLNRCLLCKMNKNINIDEQRRIRRILDGKHGEYAYFVRTYSQEVLNFTSRMILDSMDAEEVAQDAFVKAFRSLESFAFQSSFLTWVCRIAYHESLNRLKHKKAHWVDIDDVPLSGDEMLDEELSTDREERIQLLEDAIDVLSPIEQMLIHLFYYEKKTLREIAFIMDVKPNTLANRLHRIRQKLLRIIKDKENERNQG